jgi:ferric-dicitrate binding protein FerR (iron transport regulator)
MLLLEQWHRQFDGSSARSCALENGAMTGFNEVRRYPLRSRRWFLRRAAPAALLLFSFRRASAAVLAGAVEEIKGTAFAEVEAVRRTLDWAAPIFLGDEVGTEAESRLRMRLGRDTTVKLGERARLKIERFLVDAGGEIVLRSGPLLFDRPLGRPPAPVQIRTPFALIAVRGTRFFAGPSNDRFGVFVERGLVEVRAGGRRVVLHAGEGTDIAFPGAPPTPVRRWQPPRIRAALESVD